jgi:hypothetical protein
MVWLETTPFPKISTSVVSILISNAKPIKPVATVGAAQKWKSG